MIIERLDGTRIDTLDYSLHRLFHYIPSLNMRYTRDLVPGRGNITLSSDYEQRNITVQFLYTVPDISSYYLLRDQLNDLFVSNEPFYIIFKKERYKRYKVRLASEFMVTPSNMAEAFDVVFVMDDLFGESVGTSLDLQKYPTWDSALWGFGSGVDYDNKYEYVFNTSNFIVKNIGNQTVDPRVSALKITLKGTFTNNLLIANERTGDVYSCSSNFNTTDELVLEGVRSIKNGVSVFKNTNGALITLAPGDNEFNVLGGSVESIKFEFRFLYK